MRQELFTIGQAAEMAGLSIRDERSESAKRYFTLRRLEKKGLVTFKRINGRRYIKLTSLRKAPILSLGKAAELIGMSYYILRKLAKENNIAQTKSPIFRISYEELGKIKKNYGKLPSLLHKTGKS